VEIIKILLNKGMSADLKNANDSRPLHFSASKGNLEATKALVERGAPLNNANKNSAIPLILGARYGKIEVFRYLTEIGSDINPLNAELNPICHLLALLGAHHILHISRIRVNIPDAEKTLLFAMLLCWILWILSRCYSIKERLLT